VSLVRSIRHELKQINQQIGDCGQPLILQFNRSGGLQRLQVLIAVACVSLNKINQYRRQQQHHRISNPHHRVLPPPLPPHAHDPFLE
jgi:hypothetical protein